MKEEEYQEYASSFLGIEVPIGAQAFPCFNDIQTTIEPYTSFSWLFPHVYASRRERIRTADPLVVSETLYQLSYAPLSRLFS